MFRLRTLLVVLLGASLVACGSDDRLSSPVDTTSDFVILNPSQAFPTADLSDWVSYPAQLSVVTILEERELEPEADLAETGAGYLGRSVRVEVERILWRNPDEAALPATFDMRVFGWMVAEDGSRKPVKAANSPRIEVGERYAIPLTRFFEDIGPLSSHSLAQLDGSNRVLLAAGQRDPVVERFAGRDVADVQAAVSTARPDPVAKKYKTLPPYERVQAVLKERAAASKN